MLPNGTRLHIGRSIIRESRSVDVIITGGESTRINIPDLIYFKDHGAFITLEINNGGNWSEDDNIGPNEESGKAIFSDYNFGSGTKGTKNTHGLSVRNAIALLKESLEKEKT